MGDAFIQTYTYKQNKILKGGRVKEYTTTFTRKVQKEPTVLTDIECAEICKEFIRGKAKTVIAADFGITMYRINKIIDDWRERELSKIDT